MKESIFAVLKASKYPLIYFLNAIFWGSVTIFFLQLRSSQTGVPLTADSAEPYSIVYMSAACISTFRYFYKKYKGTPNFDMLLSQIKNPFNKNVAFAAIIGLFAGIFASVLLSLIKYYSIFSNSISYYEKVASGLLTYNFSIIEFIGLVLIVPIFEEFLFRGLLYQELNRKFSLIVSLFIQAIIFALYHVTPPLIIVGLLIGLLTGYLVRKSGSIATAASAHVFFNIINIFLFFVNQKNGQNWLYVTSISYWPVFFVICPLAIYFLLKKIDCKEES